MRIIFQIEFFTLWHTSSGLSGGVESKLQVIKDNQGLPFIPGKTLKGLLREAASNLNILHPEMITSVFIEQIFGTGEDQLNVTEPHKSQCFFGNATLSEGLAARLKNDEENIKQHLFTTIASTAIEENGLAKNHSLRQIEATIPLTLYAAIEGFPNEEAYLIQLEKCFQWIKKMGTNRTRGFGRCEFSYRKSEAS